MKGGNQHRRIVHRDLHRFGDRRFGAAAEDVVSPNHIGQKQRVKTALLQDCRELYPRVERGIFNLTRIITAPQTLLDMGDAVHGERVE